ncbi:peptidylprolyl isomerase, partial [bacterium]|nr:peptidylprolyl isomerase [bacterium]
MPIKKRFLTIALVAFLSVPQGFAQTETYPVFTYGEDTVYSDEFMRGFSKNNRNSENPTQAEIQEYLDLYIRFKLKVAEAYARQMDTVDQFQAELAGYRKQLAQPYLTDKEVNDRLIRQAYDRSLEEVRASHLLITCSQDAAPEDTLKAYNQILALRGRIVQGGEDFDEMARAFSQDPSASSNSGDLGYFTAFQMIYPFENAAYSTKVGEVSMPFRTRFGYHLVKVKDRRKALGDVKVAHIMIKFYNETEIDSAKRRIDAVYEQLQNGAEWQTMVDEFSEDFNSQPKG